MAYNAIFLHALAIPAPAAHELFYGLCRQAQARKGEARPPRYIEGELTLNAAGGCNLHLYCRDEAEASRALDAAKALGVRLNRPR